MIDVKRKLKDKLENIDAQTELALLRLTLSKFKVSGAENGGLNSTGNGLGYQPPAQISTIEPDFVQRATAKDHLQEIFLQEYFNTVELEDQFEEEEVDIAKRVEIFEKANKKIADS